MVLKWNKTLSNAAPWEDSSPNFDLAIAYVACQQLTDDNEAGLLF
jgi:hypothetical protein